MPVYKGRKLSVNGKRLGRPPKVQHDGIEDSPLKRETWPAAAGSCVVAHRVIRAWTSRFSHLLAKDRRAALAHGSRHEAKMGSGR
jgi:hypothetical protein